MPDSPTAAFRLSVDVRRLASMRRLAVDYAHDYARLDAFYAGNPADAASWEAAIGRVQGAERPRGAISAAVAEQQRRFGAPEAAVRAARELADPRAVAVVTGQQAGLFGGPLYTLLKAITAIQLASHVRNKYGVPAVPVFWIEAEDHDWEEVAHCSVLDKEFDRRDIRLPSLPGSGRLPVSGVPLDGAGMPAVDELANWLPATEFTPALVENLRAAYAGNTTMPEAFARVMLQVFGSEGLVLYDAADPATKPFVARLFRRELDEPGRTSQLAREAGQALVERGYHAQVMPVEGTTALFHLDGGRAPIVVGADGRVTDGSRSAAELVRETETRPAAFSPNVLLRPLVQDSLFPTVAYVAGPNELAYLGQLRPVYAHFDVPMPLMYPRASATLVDSATARFLSRSNIAFEALARNDDAELNRLLEQQLPEAVERGWQQVRDAVDERMQALIDALPQVDPTLEGAARSALGRMRHDIETLHGKIVQAAKRRDETLRRQFTRSRALTFPGGSPQERVVGGVYFLNRYGPWLVTRLLADLPMEMGQHWVLAV